MKNTINQITLTLLLLSAFFIGVSCSKKPVNGGGQPTPIVPIVPVTPAKSDVAMWLTNADRSVQFTKQNIALNFAGGSNANTTITVDTTKTYQSIDGFGFCLTGGSATVIHNLPSSQQDALLQELFATDTTHIGISYLRISI